ncbi:histone-lysine N-methyltransferase [Striga asiatica]|uniref:Histone-lysine N-methyltransferase n=1 Tax=Striga asiatica TaxID=4170 RepID=A0A5A7QE25_STRAF|nr:histone-lysine N-methyltransferase [Striga asiatica]
MFGNQPLGNHDVEYESSSHGTKRSFEVANSTTASHDNTATVERNRVKETLKLFQDSYNKLVHECKRNPKQEGHCTKRFDMEAANCLKKKGKYIFSPNHFGHIPGIKIGDKFHYRAELVIVGLHLQYISGIAYVTLNGKKIATSVVNSGRYENEAKTEDVLIYSGQGGKSKLGLSANISDQELKLGNLALVNSKEVKYPIRVIQKITRVNRDVEFVYDGLYVVNNYWQERGHDRKLVFKFELHRVQNQEKVWSVNGGGPRKKSRGRECCVVHDISQRKEKMAVRAVNGLDGEKPEKFCYVTENMYPGWFLKIERGGCDCADGCSNSGQCGCVLRNGGEIAYSEKGGLVKQKGVIYECGPSCKCPPSCMNRVSQLGSRYQLEVYKTESRGWHVRSRSYISSGNFVCEFVGKLIHQDKETSKVDGGLPSFLISKSQNINEGRSDESETRFIIDASKVGNVARFISYSSSPNLVVQRVLYDHDDERMPHVMFFAAKSIPPLHEITCDFDQKMTMD